MGGAPHEKIGRCSRSWCDEDSMDQQCAYVELESRGCTGSTTRHLTFMHALPMNVQLSNEIIARCCTVINLPTVFTGQVDEVMTVLRQSIEAGKGARGGCGFQGCLFFSRGDCDTWGCKRCRSLL